MPLRTGQINDVLKSLVRQDLGGGRIGAVIFPSQDPIERTLGSFQVNLSGGPSLGALLHQLRGPRVRVTTGPEGETVAGTLLSVEQRQTGQDAAPGC